ncbi:hypothetical protein [Agrilactobacillus composti]|uniref:hypothetical protein n=1 Tax=Agrilactobacillus composti TaxID=398555 RepID=UPI0007051B05|nr:hypothetical protein [Agrilactobacillus composti]
MALTTTQKETIHEILLGLDDPYSISTLFKTLPMRLNGSNSTKPISKLTCNNICQQPSAPMIQQSGAIFASCCGNLKPECNLIFKK